MASESSDEAKSLDDGSPAAEATGESDDGSEEDATPSDEEEGGDAEPVASEAEVQEKPKRGRKRKSPGVAKEQGAEKRERKRQPVSSVVASPVERPSRERKPVERFISLTPPRSSVSKVISVEQGPGVMMKEIPNVFFKLSKRKTDENLQALHTILFGRKSNAHYLKRNILQFSGFVWTENEEKQRERVKEKLDKCTKDRLLDFSDLLDIQIARATTKKEEITLKLLEFLESPRATRDVVLAEKEKKGKRKRTKGSGHAAGGRASSERELKVFPSSTSCCTKRKSSLETEVKKRQRWSAKVKKEDEGDLAEKEDEDEHGSAEKDVDGGGSTDNDDTSNAENDSGDTKEESDHANIEEEEKVDEPEEPTVSTKASDKKQRKVAEPKVKEKISLVKKGSPARSDKIRLKSVPKNAVQDAKDAPHAPVPSKKGSVKGQTSRLSKTNTKEKAAATNRGSVKTSKIISKSPARKSTVADSDSGPPSSSKLKKETKKNDRSNESQVPKNNKGVKKQAASSLSKKSDKGQGKGKAGGDSNVRPSREELHSAVSNILKEVDFNTATLADILKQLGAHFNTNLMNRKVEVKQIIEDVVNNMTDDEEGEEDEDVAEDAEGGEGAKEGSDGDSE